MGRARSRREPNATARQFLRVVLGPDRTQTIDLNAALERVDARGGAKAPWAVDWDHSLASLETMEVSFDKLQLRGRG